MSPVAPSDLLALSKPRIVVFVLITVAAGFLLAAPPRIDVRGVIVLVHALIGTLLVAGGTNALNQVLERDLDALMPRTARRPLPSGRLDARIAAIYAGCLSVAGIAYLLRFTDPVTTLLAAATLVTYVTIYTPLKRHSELSTVVGAVPGALPIVGGWTAAGGPLDGRAVTLFAILFLWQMPHFLALSWIYREQYGRAGMRMLSVTDDEGRGTFGLAAVHTAALLPVALAPTLLGLAGGAYFLGAAALSGGFLAIGLASARTRSPQAARRLFMSSLVYLPALLTLMTADRRR
ncbi:MAG: heme o synthase [Gemmatimonadaceae bacterium]